MPRIFARFENEAGEAPRLSHDLAQVNRIQSVLQSGGVLPFIDLPFAPLFFVVLFLVHPVLGLIGLGGGVLVFAVAILAEMSTRQDSQFSQAALSGASDLASGLQRQRSAMVAMGLMPAAFAKWQATKSIGQGFALNAARDDSKFTAISRSSRQILQIFILGGGAALALAQEISPGAIVASSIIMARALGPIDQIVGGWRSSIQAWKAWKELGERLEAAEPTEAFTPMPRPKPELDLDRLGVMVPGAEEPLIRPFSFRVEACQIVALAGGNGSGKTTLLQTMARGLASCVGYGSPRWPHPARMA